MAMAMAKIDEEEEDDEEEEEEEEGKTTSLIFERLEGATGCSRFPAVACRFSR
jgi:hypothetical protein